MVCDKCNGACCTNFVIYVTAHDAVRIAKNCSLEPTYFLNFYPVVGSMDLKHPVFKLKGRDYVLGLDSKDGTMKDCKFMMDIGGSKRCGIHKHRPLNCRTYPFILKDSELDLAEDHLCPKQWWPEGKEKEDYIKHTNQFNKELEEYKKIVEIWNRNFGEKGSFLEFLHFIMKEVKI